MRTARKISILVVALVVMTIGLAIPAQAGTEGAFLSKINSSRAAAGLPPLSSYSSLVSFARAHSAEMMAAGNIYHSSNLGSAASGWEALAENVGVGPSVDSLHAAFMSSSGHRRNILGNYNYAGVGVATDGDGAIWVTVVFMRKNMPPPTTTTTTTTTAPPATPPMPDPAPTTTTTMAPAPAPAPAPASTTTTTMAPAPAKKVSNPTPAPAAAPKPEVVEPFAVAPHAPIAD